MNGARWTHGDAALGEAALARIAAAGARPIRESAQRALWRVPCGGRDVAVKRFRVGSGKHPFRERAKAAIGRAPALREWHALARVRSVGIAAPEPLALGTLAGGDRVLVSEWIDGSPLDAALDAPFRDRTSILDALALAVRRLHEAGLVHGDLHAGNVIVREGTPVLLDWQHTRAASVRARRRDLARLEFALAPIVSRGRRLRVRRAVLGSHATEAALRDAGRAASRRAREHARSRTRDACRPGGIARRVALGERRGLALREIDDAALAELFANAAGVTLADSTRSRVTAQRLAGRAVVVKAAPYRGVARALADLVRGSAAMRAWRGGHGLRVRGIGAATPLAALERRVLGVPVASWVVLEDLRPAPVAAFAAELGTARVLDALGSLAIRLHRTGTDHGDLKATHVFLASVSGRLAPQLVDLEGVRFDRRRADAWRRRALAELNASLPDAFPAAERRRVFARYAAALPFDAGARSARDAIVRASLAREHRWTGAGCTLGGASGA